MKKVVLIIIAGIAILIGLLFLKTKEKIGYGGAIDGAEHKTKHCIGIVTREEGVVSGPDAPYSIYCRGLTYGQSFTF
jgi:hypothetical protein